MSTTSPVKTAAQLLENRVLKGRWLVESSYDPGTSHTGSKHSVCYLVSDVKTKQKAFLKAIDYERAFRNADAKGTQIADEIAGLTNQFNFEKFILETCRDAALRHVVQILDFGKEKVTGQNLRIEDVDYLIP